MIREIQLEGGAVLCEKQCLSKTLSKMELEKGIDGFKKCDEWIQSWLDQGKCEISEEAWETYYTLWGPEKLVYWLGEFLCLLLVQYGSDLSVAKCMTMEPLDFWIAAKCVIDALYF